MPPPRSRFFPGFRVSGDPRAPRADGQYGQYGPSGTRDTTGTTSRREPRADGNQRHHGHKKASICASQQDRGHKMVPICAQPPPKTLRGHIQHTKRAHRLPDGHKSATKCAKTAAYQILHQMCQHRYLPNVPKPLPTKSATKCAKTATAVPLLKRHYLAHYFFDLRALFIERLNSRSSNITMPLSCNTCFTKLVNYEHI